MYKYYVKFALPCELDDYAFKCFSKVAKEMRGIPGLIDVSWYTLREFKDEQYTHTLKFLFIDKTSKDTAIQSASYIKAMFLHLWELINKSTVNPICITIPERLLEGA